MKEVEAFSKYGPWAVVAGASIGLGECFSRKLAARGMNLVLIARGAEKLELLADELRVAHSVEVRTAALDLGQADVIESLQPVIADLEVGLLVYNAAYGEIGDFLETELEDKLKTLDVNCRGPLLFVSAFAPGMVERGRGGILLMSSMTGFCGSAKVSTYAASKAFNTVLGEGLWEDFRRRGVDVLVAVAGATKTPNFIEATPAAKVKGLFAMEPEPVVEEALRALGKGPTRIAGALNKLVAFVTNRLLSRRAAVGFLASKMRDLYGS